MWAWLQLFSLGVGFASRSLGSLAPSFDRSQTFTVLSRLPEYKRLPSGLNATLLTMPVWPRKVWTSFPVRLSQIFTVLSSPPEAIHRPSSSGLNATV